MLFLRLYEGETEETARLVYTTNDENLVAMVTPHLRFAQRRAAEAFGWRDRKASTEGGSSLRRS